MPIPKDHFVPYKVAIMLVSATPDEIALTIREALQLSGHHPIFVRQNTNLPHDTDVLFSYGYAPPGHIHSICQKLSPLPQGQRPAWIHWSTEDLPDLRIPWPLTLNIGRIRSGWDRLQYHQQAWIRRFVNLPGIRQINQTMNKFRYVGEYCYALDRGLLTLLAESSKIYANYYNSKGINAEYAPWGIIYDSYAGLSRERDIDVLWLGIRRTRRRSHLLNRLRRDLKKQNISIYVVDGVEHPFIFGDARTELLNRTKITLNLLPTWYDSTLMFRFPLAAANRSLIVSEPSPEHEPLYQPHIHYVSASVDKLAGAILYYLQNELERLKIVDSAYTLMMKHESRMQDTVQSLVDLAIKRKVNLCGVTRPYQSLEYPYDNFTAVGK